MEELVCARIFFSLASGAGNFLGLCMHFFIAIHIVRFFLLFHKGFAGNFFPKFSTLNEAIDIKKAEKPDLPQQLQII